MGFRFRIMEVAREIEQVYGLTVARPKHPIHLTRPALERLLRDPDRAKVMTAIRRAIDQAGTKHDTLRAFLMELHRLGVVAEIKVARRSGVLQGIRFVLPDGHWIKGSDLGKDYSLARICHRHELRFDRRPEGRYLVLSEVTEKELRTLQGDDLAPDQVVRYGSRRTLFWELPPEHESGFVDLVAARLPHRFLTFSDELPKGEITPDLDERARRVRRVLDLAEAGPEVAPPLPLPAEYSPDAGTIPATEPAARCQEFSAALLAEGELPPANGVALRAAYHEAMVEALSRSPLRSDREEKARNGAAPLEIEPAQLLVSGTLSLGGGTGSPEIEPAQFPARPGPRVGGGFSVHSPGSIGHEAALVAAFRYERDASEEAFRDWARLQQALRRAPGWSRGRSIVVSRETGLAALEVLVRDLREAHERFTAEPSADNQQEVARRLAAYEELARPVERPGSSWTGPRHAGTVALEVLKTELLFRHDRYLADPTAETEEAWQRARRSYEAAISSQRPEKPRVPAEDPTRAMAREDSIGRHLRRQLREEEARFLATPYVPEARERWVTALGSLRESEARLAEARLQHFDQASRDFRQSASTLAFYERAYFHSPSPLTERLWRQAERAHLRSSLLFERMRLELSAPEQKHPQDRPVPVATASLTRVFEKQILGRDLPGRNFARYNPLLSVRPHPYDVQDVSLLAQLLVPDSPGKDPFWPQSSRTLLEGILLYVLYAEAEKTLASCYRFLCSPEIPIQQQFERMLATEHDPSGAHRWKHHPRVQTAARTFLDMPAQTRGGVVANALASLSPYADPILDAATAVSDFALEDLYTAQERPVSLYLVIDPNSLQRLADHIRIVLSQIAAALTRELPAAGARQPVLLLLDEFPAFGRMKAIETAIAYFRGYGLQCYIVVQHVGQLVAAYGQSESISPNCSVHIAFAPADLQTATQLSERAGSQTVRYERGSVSSQGPLRSHVSVQEADSGRPLFMPDEIMRLPKGQALVLRTGAYPLIVRPRPFFEDPLRQAAASLPLPLSERSVPDFRHWLDRAPVAPPVKTKPARRAGIDKLLNSELLP